MSDAVVCTLLHSAVSSAHLLSCRELPRHDIVYEVGMYGKVGKYQAADGTERCKW